MLAISRMSRFMRLMRAVSWLRLRAAAPAEPLSGRSTAFQIQCPRIKRRYILTFSLRPILIHSARAREVVAVEQAGAQVVGAKAALVAREAARAGAVTIPCPATTIRHSTSRAPLFRHFHLRR